MIIINHISFQIADPDISLENTLFQGCLLNSVLLSCKAEDTIVEKLLVRLESDDSVIAY